MGRKADKRVALQPFYLPEECKDSILPRDVREEMGNENDKTGAVL